MSSSDTSTFVPPIAVAVFREGVPLYALDAAGRAFAVDGPEDRTAVAVLLAQAAGALAGLPPAEPGFTASWVARLLHTLEEIGTPEAETAHAALGDAHENLTGALDLAKAVLSAVLPTEH